MQSNVHELLVVSIRIVSKTLRGCVLISRPSEESENDIYKDVLALSLA